MNHNDTKNTKKRLQIVNCKLQIVKCRSGHPHFTFYVFHFAFCILCFSSCPLSLCGSLSAAPLVVPVDGETFAGELVSIDTEAGRIVFRPATESAAPNVDVAITDFVRWSHPALPRPQTMVLLTGGSRIVTAADWSGGAAVRMDGDALVVRSDIVNETKLGRSQVAGLVFANRKSLRDRLRLEDQIRGTSNDKDELWLTNRDRLSGTLTELSGGSLSFDTEFGVVKLPLSRVEAIAIGKQGAGSREQGVKNDRRDSLPDPGCWLLGLRDGSLLYADKVQADGSKLDLRLADGAQVSGGTVADITSLQSLGERFVYLADVDPADYRHVPYLELAWPFERDRNVLGEPLVVGGNQYAKGLGMHSAGRLTYRLDGTYRRFDAAVAVDDSADGRGSVVFGVYLLRDGKWQAAYTSGIVRGGEDPQDVSVDLAGAQGLALTVDYADRGDELDHADWLDARLIR
jgi:hypothetical protein